MGIMNSANSFAPFFLIPGLGIAAWVFSMLVVLEALVLTWMSWSSFGRALRASILVNLFSAVVGLVVILAFIPEADRELAATHVARIWLFMLVTVVAEGCLLMVLNRRALGQAWQAALASNMASYLVVVLPLVLLVPRLDLGDSGLKRGKQKRTMADMRSVGVAIESYIIDYGHPPGVIRGNVEQLQDQLAPTYIRVLPATDGWKANFLYESTGREGAAYWVVSTGRDKVLDGPSFRRTGTTGNFDCDIIFSNGEFIRYPEGPQD